MHGLQSSQIWVYPHGEEDSQDDAGGNDESLMKLAVYFCNWHMFHKHMNNIAC